MSDFESKMGRGLAYGIGAGAAGAAGIGIAKNQEKYQQDQEKYQQNQDTASKAAAKMDEIKRSQAPSGTEGPDSTARPLARKKGGVVKLFRHHDGIAQKGKTRA